MTTAKKVLNNIMGDWDKDKVINALDCQPKNKRKQGVADIARSGLDRMQDTLSGKSDRGLAGLERRFGGDE